MYGRKDVGEQITSDSHRGQLEGEAGAWRTTLAPI